MSETKDKRTTGNTAAVPVVPPPVVADDMATGNGAADSKATGNGAAVDKATGNGAGDGEATGNGAAAADKATGNEATDDKAKKSGAATDDKKAKGKAAADAPSPSALLPHGAMLDSTAYVRLRAAHPEEFAPASVFFAHDPGSAMDRANSFRVKAALVYEAVTRQHVDDHMQLANRLLLALARQCHAKINGQISKEAGDHHPTAEDAEETDKGWDPEKKRVVDGIFLVVGFLPKLDEAIRKNASRDSVDQTFKSRHMVDIVTDVIKLENQLHLKDLIDVARHAEDAVRETLKRPDFKDVKKSMGSSSEYNLAVTVDNLADVIHDFCWYYSPFATKRQTAAAPSFKDVVDSSKDAAASRTLLDCLYMSVAKPAAAAAAQGKQQGGTGGGGGGPSRMPTAKDLRRSGVRFQAFENGRAEIEFVQPAVWLPALVYDFKLATVALNLLAREYGEQSKPVTRYFQMMNEMVEDAGDVRVLRRAGVVRGGSGGGGGQEVLEVIKRIDGRATYPSVYMAMDREIDRVREYHDKRMASFFVRNRPGVIWASSVAAVSVAAIVATRRKRG